MTSPPTPVRPGRPRTAARSFDDAGGVWIATGIVAGLMVYALIVLMDVAGFTAVLPLVVVPPVVLGLIAANSLLGGGRGHGRSSGRPVGEGGTPLSSSGTDGTVTVTSPMDPGGSPSPQ